MAYAVSPIDLIPDPIPVLGYLDDLVLLPLGILLARKLIPAAVLDDCRREAESREHDGPTGGWAAAVIVGIWLGALAACGYIAWSVL